MMLSCRDATVCAWQTGVLTKRKVVCEVLDSVGPVSKPPRPAPLSSGAPPRSLDQLACLDKGFEGGPGLGEGRGALREGPLGVAGLAGYAIELLRLGGRHTQGGPMLERGHSHRRGSPCLRGVVDALGLGGVCSWERRWDVPVMQGRRGGRRSPCPLGR